MIKVKTKRLEKEWHWAQTSFATEAWSKSKREVEEDLT